MKLAFVWYWNKASEIYPNWRDGLRAAIEELDKEHDVTWFWDKETPPPDEDWDGIIFWDDSNSGFFDELDNYDCPVVLCLTTDPQNFNNLRKLNAVLCESTPVYNQVRSQGIRAIKAFGTDIAFYKPKDDVVKDIEYFYPATFSPWKRQSDIAYLGDKLLCIGTVQPDGHLELEACLENGVVVMEGYFPAEVIRDYYRRAKKVIIPAIHGSERTILEAMACNILPQVTNPKNMKAESLIREYHLSGSKTPRDFVEVNYSPKRYAKNILKGLTND
jgi:hypothetical protein